MTSLSISSARNNLAELTHQVELLGERIVLKRRNKPVAVLVSVQDMKLLEAWEEQADRVQRYVKAAASIAYPSPDSLETIRGHLQAGDALVMYRTTSASPFALVVTPTETRIASIVDAGVPTYMLLHWGRDRRRGPRLPLELLVKRQTSETADFFGLHDRGRLAAWYAG